MDADDVRQLWEICPDTETITLRRRRQESQEEFDDFPVPNAKRERRPGGFDFSRTGSPPGRYNPRQVVVFKIWRDQLPEGVLPRYDDVIVDRMGIAWSVQHVERQLFGTRYRCVCVALEDPKLFETLD